MTFAKPLAALIAELERLPGVGPKSAQRLAFHLLRVTDDDVRRLARVLVEAKETLRLCDTCQNISEKVVCEICSDPRRNANTICVVGEARDIAAIERLNEYRGKFHVLHGMLSPMDGIGPEQLKVRELIVRLTDEVE